MAPDVTSQVCTTKPSAKPKGGAWENFGGIGHVEVGEGRGALPPPPPAGRPLRCSHRLLLANVLLPQPSGLARQRFSGLCEPLSQINRTRGRGGGPLIYGH